MPRRHKLSKKVDELALASELSSRLGRAVHINVGQPRDGADGSVVVVVDGEAVDVSDADMAAVVAAHVAPVRRTPAGRLHDEVTAASSVAQVRAALLTFAQAMIDRGL